MLKRLRGTPIVRHDAEFGMRYAASVGWDHRGMERFIRVLGAHEGPSVGQAYSSHPTASDRIARLRRIVQSKGWIPSGNLQRERFVKRTKCLHE